MAKLLEAGWKTPDPAPARAEVPGSGTGNGVMLVPKRGPSPSTSPRHSSGDYKRVSSKIIIIVDEIWSTVASGANDTV